MSEVKIDKVGNLYIKRGGKFKPQYCPHTGENYSICGDWCPNFGEPYHKRDGDVLIVLCGTTSWLVNEGKLVDERE